MVGSQKLTWKRITASTNYFDFNTVLKTHNDRATFPRMRGETMPACLHAVKKTLEAQLAAKRKRLERAARMQPPH